MVQVVKCLLHKYEDLSLDPGTQEGARHDNVFL